MEPARSSGIRKGMIPVLIGLSLLLLTNLSWGSDRHPSHVEDELLIQPKAGVSEAQIAGALNQHGAVSADDLRQIRVRKIKVSPSDREKVKASLARDSRFNFVESNAIAAPQLTPNDASYASQWHLPKISAPQGWDISTGSNTVIIAVADTGIDPAHPDLAGKLIPGFNIQAGTSDTHDVYGHGTRVAGSAAAISNNLSGVAGVAWKNPIMPLVISDSTGYATYYNMAQAITYAVDHGAKVINISFGGSSSSATLQNAVNYAWSKGAVIFASAANYSTSTPYYPAACTNVVAVSATASNDSLASFSNFGSWVDISAPGVSILTTSNGGGYGYASGTSFSSPIAAGLAALIMSLNPSLTNSQVVDIMLQNSDDLGTPGFDPYFGYGRINVHKSLLAATATEPQPDVTPPSVSIASPGQGSSVSGTTSVNVAASDDTAVSRVELYINSALFGTDSTSPHSFSWDTTKYANRTYTLVARGYDSAGNIGQSQSIAVTVNNPVITADTTPPVVTITSPANGSRVERKVQIKVTAADASGVSKIELFIDGALKKTVTSTTALTYGWNPYNATPGSHTITARAYDTRGNLGSTSITVYK